MCSTSRLKRLLLEQAGPSATIQSSTEAEWNSVTFSGVRHQICFSFTEKSDAEGFAAWVNSEDEVELPGYLLADLCILETDEILPLGHVFMTVEVLTLNK